MSDYLPTIHAANDRYHAQVVKLASMRLRELMGSYSLQFFLSAWERDLEGILWDAVRSGGGRCGMGWLNADEAKELRELSALCGGWWHWPDGATEPVFVTLDEWAHTGTAVHADR